MKTAVLAGGRATRFGGVPKGLERVGGERLLDRVIRSLKEAAGEDPLVIANTPDADTWVDGLQVVPDRRPGCGALGGIHTAVVSAADSVLVAAWDMPFLEAGLLAAMIEKAAPYDVYLPESRGPLGFEPLCGVYGPGCVGPIVEALDDADFRTSSFHDKVRVGLLPLGEVEQHGELDVLFFNVNTFDDVSEAEELWKNRSG